MRIGMMTDNYETHISGVTNYIHQLKRCLNTLGHSVYVFTFDKRGGIDQEENIIYTRGFPITDFYINFSYNRNSQKILSSMDIVHIHHPFMSGVLAQRYCKPNNIPMVFTNHTRYDLYSQTYVPIIPKFMIEAGLKSFLSRFYRSCDLVIIPSEEMQGVMSEHFGLNCASTVIPTGVDLAPFSGDTEPVDREALGFFHEDVILIYVGRLAPEKNLPFLLRAFQKAASISPDIRLLVVGDGPERKKLETQVKETGLGSKIYFTGMIPYCDVPHYLPAADIFLTASLTEVFPLTAIEAAGAGLPVLGIDAPGIKDIVEDGISGLISPNDLDAFVSRIVQLANEKELRARLGKQARQVSQKYDIRTTTSMLLEKYQNLVETAQQRNTSVKTRQSSVKI